MRIHLAFALIACAAHAKPADDALAALLLNSKFAVNPSATRSTLQKPLVASRQVVMKELDSEAVNKDLLSLATMAATLMPAAAHAEIVPSLQAFFNSILTQGSNFFVITWRVGCLVEITIFTMVRIFFVLALMACGALAKPADDALAKLLLNSGVRINPSAVRSTLQRPIASRQVVMKEFDSEAQVNKKLLALAAMAATMMPGAASAEIVPSLQAFFNSLLFGSIVVGGIFAALSFVAVSDQTDRA
eukprot:CAMPEP_0169217506 /NCGR_PEP_ID=MMETSP1016-20121227/18941_1 /TAXON_ID=342587 /ORGANISM="Karlodinium micrum, Strain CCMP2283" /LENGTH=245 /DNA_ID=CAMNT_0009295431 /DNA_START=46 /DNA_END=783 /DNA_ORIENTATION=-